MAVRAAESPAAVMPLVTGLGVAFAMAIRLVGEAVGWLLPPLQSFDHLLLVNIGCLQGNGGILSIDLGGFFLNGGV